jgi:hypothetical protein
VKLNVTLADKVFAVDLAEDFLRTTEDFYRKMDRDMERGWQMSREFIEHPDRTQRCQIAANRLMTSMSGGNTTMVELMAGYILTRLPGVIGVDIDTAGEMSETTFTFAAPTETVVPEPRDQPLNKVEALAQAGRDVSKVYKSGHGWRFAVLDRKTGQWLESGPSDREQEAEKRRLAAVKRRYEELLGSETN